MRVFNIKSAFVAAALAVTALTATSLVGVQTAQAFPKMGGPHPWHHHHHWGWGGGYFGDYDDDGGCYVRRFYDDDGDLIVHKYCY